MTHTFVAGKLLTLPLAAGCSPALPGSHGYWNQSLRAQALLGPCDLGTQANARLSQPHCGLDLHVLAVFEATQTEPSA